MAFIQFDATKVAPRETFDPIPAGTYHAIVGDSEIVATKEGTGQRLKLVWTVTEGEFKGRKVFDSINISHVKANVEEIGQRQLSQLCHATNVLHLQDTAQLHGIQCAIKVAIRHDTTGQWPDSNEVKGYYNLGGSPAISMPTNTSAVNTPPPPPPKKAQAPWMANKGA